MDECVCNYLYPYLEWAELKPNVGGAKKRSGWGWLMPEINIFVDQKLLNVLFLTITRTDKVPLMMLLWQHSVLQISCHGRFCFLRSCLIISTRTSALTTDSSTDSTNQQVQDSQTEGTKETKMAAATPLPASVRKGSQNSSDTETPNWPVISFVAAL